jgi:hypothetical protein
MTTRRELLLGMADAGRLPEVALRKRMIDLVEDLP